MKHVHIVGIAGTFMGGIARLALACGYRVTGCDAHIYPPMSTQLETLGIEIIEGFGVESLRLNPDIFIIGNVAKRGMPIVEAILNEDKPYTSGPQWLYEHILRGKHILAVAGTHGKTSTSSMLAWILDYAQQKPGFLIGGVPENFNVSARLTESPYFVIEADEYDTAFFDKRSKFVHYHPKTLIINNLEFDHADIFENLKAIQTQFNHLIRMMPSSGSIICSEKQPAIKAVLDKGVWTPVTFLGHESGYHTLSQKPGQAFDIYFQDKYLDRIHWNLLGVHNQRNALAAILAASQVGISVSDSCRALEQFAGIKRRMQIRGIVNGITVYDDFAHHPTAIRLTLEGLRDKIGPDKRILAILELRSNTMKLGVIREALVTALEEADGVFCYTGHIKWDLEDTLRPLQQKVWLEKDFNNLVEKILSKVKVGDHLLIMSNGDFQKIHELLLAKLQGNFS
ncbi:MAG: UDP-N-acetylmuramate:L-alanyl-gamma-D-glutamyl-meso-diaminopimelate ligase [Neisseriaceae bacterium]